MVLRFDRVAFGLLALVLVMSSAQQDVLADEPVMLTEQEILAQIIGNTASGASAKHRWSEYYQPDGTIRGRSDHGAGVVHPTPGKWTISGSQMCFDYVDTGDAGCWTISVEGSEITFYSNEKDETNKATLLKGNPKNF